MALVLFIVLCHWVGKEICPRIKGCYLNAQLFPLGYTLAFVGVEGSEVEMMFRNSEINANLCDDWLAKGTLGEFLNTITS